MKRILLPSCFLMTLLCLSSNISATTRHVPSEYPTIQAGIDAAVNGDTVLVADGTYTGDGNRDIDFKGKAITVISENGAENCVIDCEGSESENHRGFYFHTNEDENSVILGFTIQNGFMNAEWPEYGAGINCNNASPKIENCIISCNTDYHSGGGIQCYDNASPTIRFCRIVDNYAKQNGGGLYINSDSSPMIENCIITGNTANINGGGMYLIWSSSPTIISCTILNNRAIEGGGGGIEESYYASPNILESTISANTAGWGGGISLKDEASVYLANCNISENKALHITTGRGGGISLIDEASATIINCTISNNIANNAGGGIYNRYKSSHIIITNSIIVENRTENGIGGGICSGYLTSPVLTNCLISKNTASENGGGIYLTNSTAVITNCTISENTANEQGGGFYSNGDDLATFTNCILWNDAPDEIFVDDANPTFTFSCVQGGFEGSGNIDSDPLFARGANGNYYLSHIAAGQSANSSCIDSGSDLASNICFDSMDGEICMNELWTRTDGVTDLGQVDMGCHHPLPVVPQQTGVEIYMPSNNLLPGDICYCNANIFNGEAVDLQGYPLFVILDVFGSYYFAPSFSEFDYYSQSFPPGSAAVIVIPEFTWPSGVGSASGLMWYGALTNPEMTELFGEMGTFEFGWSE